MDPKLPEASPTPEESLVPSAAGDKPVLMKAPYDPTDEEEMHECCGGAHHDHR